MTTALDIWAVDAVFALDLKIVKLDPHRICLFDTYP